MESIWCVKGKGTSSGGAARARGRVAETGWGGRRHRPEGHGKAVSSRNTFGCYVEPGVLE